MSKIKFWSFTARIIASVVCALAINLAYGSWLFSILSGNTYIVHVDATTTGQGTLELFWDSGSGFKEQQKQVFSAVDGRNSYTYQFDVPSEERLKLFRIDFGPKPYQGKVNLHSFKLVSHGVNLFNLNSNEIESNIIYSQGFEGLSASGFSINGEMKPFDPYFILSPVNELILPLWARLGLLILPWVVFFLGPVGLWIKDSFQKRDHILILIGLFFISISLKPAWVTFTSLLILSYALTRFFVNRKFAINWGTFAVLLLFIIPFLLLGDGRVSKLSIPLGFVWFPLTVGFMDIGKQRSNILTIYVRIFCVLMSISLVSWCILVLQTGYFHGIDIHNYFSEIKAASHLVLFWLYFPHPTFLSFFVLIGTVFCLDLYYKNAGQRSLNYLYWIVSILFLLIIGSRIGLLMAIVLPLVALLPLKPLKILLIPFWALLFVVIWYNIESLDPLRHKLWQLTLNKIAVQPWFGYGTGSSEIILPDGLYLDGNAKKLWIPVNHSHNQFLTYLIENGIIGLLGILAAFGILWKALVSLNNKTAMLLFFMLLLLMTVESPFRTTNVLYIISFVFSIYLCPPFNKQPSGQPGQY